MIFKDLPQDIISHILLYNNSIKYRNGKYMNQISKTDERYKLLKRIKPIKKNKLVSNCYEIFICGHVYDNIIYKDTCTSLNVEVLNDCVIYVFSYDYEADHYNFHVWTRY
jgi:hypothetical protein